jgi:DMSO reductase family type II enzyme heme b subunit
MKATYLNVPDESLLDPISTHWDKSQVAEITMLPAPLAMVAHLSPFMALNKDHGKVNKLWVRVIHNRGKLSIHLSWADDSKNHDPKDLDEFVDAAAVMFPLTEGANAITMGDSENPVNAWFWKADQPQPFDVIAHGFGTSQKRSAEPSGLKANASYKDGKWHVVFQRPLRISLISSKHVSFAPGPDAKLNMAFAIWEGANNERSAQKAFSGTWTTIGIDL